MLTILSPAKTLDFESRLPTKKHSEPRMLNQSAGLIEVLRTKSATDIRELMDISEELATLNVERFQEFDLQHSKSNSRAAILAFNGTVYQGLAACDFDARDFTESQKTLRILSGLYGLLRPLDLVQPHRLEMGTGLCTARGTTLYEWWGDRVTDALCRDLDASPGADVLVNLASQEYYKVVNEKKLDVPVITPRFEDRDKNGKRRVVSFHAKRARGAMAGWLIRNRVRTPGKLSDFNEMGYCFDEESSTKQQPIYVR